MLLKRLTQEVAPSGREDAVADIIKDEIKDFCDEVSKDALGNLVAHKKGTKKKIMVAAHMDEIGVMVTFIDDNGFLRFSTVGGVYVKDLVGRRVVFANKIIGVIASEEDNKEKKLNKMYIDIGAESKEKAQELVSIGDMAVFEGDLIRQGDTIISKALDNRIGCYILIEALKRVKSDNDLYFCFTSQEEVGLRGALTSAFSIKPEIAVAVDVTDTGDTPGCLPMAVKMGKGAAIKVMDASVICDVQLRDLLIQLAKKNDIPYQLEVMTYGGTDAGAIHTAASGVRTAGISIPTRYIHSPSEMASEKDVQACIDLLLAFLEEKFN